ncbi:class I SAM-dependent methyltransferase [Flaviaesturariibacter amylovorans]|uniref:Class I SAM-dependent methyltransferase n=1 Tax=Flaviaesturariibacter amylovorans TaxID=1084520 RepID=A0ABP8GX66_9BACT
MPEHYESSLGPILFEPYAQALAALVPEGAGQLLELACGTGRLTRHLLPRLPAGGTLEASDLNPDMLAVAKRLLQDPRLRWSVADAQELPFAEGRFDAVLCGFGLMFVPDKPKALREMHRVLRPGGRLLATTWDSMAQNPRAAIIAEVMEEVLGPAAPDFLSVGPYSLYDAELLHGLLQAAGFRAVRIEKRALESRCTDAAALVNGYVDGSPLGQYLDRKGGHLRAMIKKRLLDAFGRQSKIYGTRVPMQALLIEASK